MATTKLRGKDIALAGQEVNVGDIAPVVTVVGQDLNEIQVGNKEQVIISVPSLDTPRCAGETRKFNEMLADSSTEAVVISMDLPFAAERFCTTEGIENLLVASDFRNKEFSNAYGVLLAEGPLEGITCRSVFITDENGVVIYKEITEDLSIEPDYEKILEYIK